MHDGKDHCLRFQQKIGVVTAQSGAAIQDICSTIERRYPLAEIILFPAIVQGPQAAPSIVKSIEQADSIWLHRCAHRWTWRRFNRRSMGVQ